MKRLSTDKLIKTITNQRKSKSLSQAQLSELTGINRTMIVRIEKGDYIPTIDQLQNLAEALNFDITELFVEDSSDATTSTNTPTKTEEKGPKLKLQKNLRPISLVDFIEKNFVVFFKKYTKYRRYNSHEKINFSIDICLKT